jgi:acyl-CoA dehydrogenase
MTLPRLHTHAWMSDDLEAFRDQVRRYALAEIAPHMDRYRRQGHVPRQVWAAFGALGFLLPEMPEAYGGAGVSQAWQMVVQDELARIGMPAITGVHSITAHYILAYGTDEQKQRWLPKLVSGEHLAAIAMTEPGCGSDLKTLRTRARRDGDHYVIDGSKIFITNGSLCTLLVLVCRTGGDGAKGISLVVLETQDLPGFKVGRVLEKMGMHAVDTCELFFDQVRVPCNQLLGPVEGQGLPS